MTEGAPGQSPPPPHNLTHNCGEETHIDRNDLILEGHRNILVLFEEFGETSATIQEALGGSIEVGTELGEGCNLAILGELQFQSPGDLLHRLPLRSRANARHREANIDRRADATIEELRLEEDLAVGD